MTNEEVDRAAQTVWNYMLLHNELTKSEVLFVLCSYDLRVAERAAELFNQGLADYVIVSGGSGDLTEKLFNKPEADMFAEVMERQGVPASKIIPERHSRNTGENVTLSYRELQKRNLHPKTFILVQKPYMERRTYATFMKLWPEPVESVQVTSPQLSYDSYFTEEFPKDLVLNVMVGDLQRIKEYPKRGFQIEQDIPKDVWQAYELLVAAGFTQRLIK